MPIPKTKFIEILERIHKKTGMRYGQIICNALKQAGIHAEGANRAYFDTFNIKDETFTSILEVFEKTLS